MSEYPISGVVLIIKRKDKEMKKTFSQVIYPSLNRSVFILLFFSASEIVEFLRFGNIASVLNFMGTICFIWAVVSVMISEGNKGQGWKIVFCRSCSELFFQWGFMIIFFSLFLFSWNVEDYVFSFIMLVISIVVILICEHEGKKDFNQSNMAI